MATGWAFPQCGAAGSDPANGPGRSLLPLDAAGPCPKTVPTTANRAGAVIDGQGYHIFSHKETPICIPMEGPNAPSGVSRPWAPVRPIIA